MRTLVPSILACLALAAVSSGCGNPERAPLSVNWTFGTLDCDQAGIATIHVEVAHELLNPSDFSCIDPRSGGVTFGADLGNFLLGQYTVTVIGLDATGAEVVEATRTVSVVRGKNVVQVDAGGAITLQWTFNGLTCAQAGVRSMNLSVDGSVITDGFGHPDIPCTQSGQDAAQIAPLVAGAHSFDLVGLLGDGTPAYVAFGVPLSVQDGQDAAFAIDLDPAAPAGITGADLSFSFGSGLTCTSAGLDTVRIFVDPNPDGTRGPNTVVLDVACTPGVTGAVVSPLDPGIHSFAVLGIRGSQLLYATRNPPSALIEPGLETPIDVNAPAVGTSGLAEHSTSLQTPARKVAPKAFPARALDAN
jgi:hypothetical protein